MKTKIMEGRSERGKGKGNSGSGRNGRETGDKEDELSKMLRE